MRRHQRPGVLLGTGVLAADTLLLDLAGEADEVDPGLRFRGEGQGRRAVAERRAVVHAPALFRVLLSTEVAKRCLEHRLGARLVAVERKRRTDLRLGERRGKGVEFGL